MKKVVSIDSLVLDNGGLFVMNDLTRIELEANALRTLGGGLILFERQVKRVTNEIILDSFNYGWQGEDVVRQLRDFANRLQGTYEIWFSDNTMTNARFKVEDNDFFSAEPLYEGAYWYKVKIKIMEV